jgi:hypothetical protein
MYTHLLLFTTQVFSFLNVDILKNKYKQFNTSTIKTTTVLKYCKSASHTVIFNNYRHKQKNDFKDCISINHPLVKNNVKSLF